MFHLHTNTLRQHPRLPVIPKIVLWFGAISLIAILLAPSASALQARLPSLSASSAATSAEVIATQLRSPDYRVREQAIKQLSQAARSGSPEATSQLASFFQNDPFVADDALLTAQALASAGSRRAYQALIQGFQEKQPSARRYAAMTALEKAQPAVVPLLIIALRDADAGVRSGSAELLGFRNEALAADALIAATDDADPRVREAAAWAVGGELAIWPSLPRLQWLQVTDDDRGVREAARLGEERIRADIARALSVPPSELRAVVVAPMSRQVFAATSDALYAFDGDRGRRISQVPNVPTALAVGGPNDAVIYLGTLSAGPFLSHDGGQTWEPIRAGLPAAGMLTVTALVLDPTQPTAQQVYMALAATVGTTQLHTTPLGIFRSDDGGRTWSTINDASVPVEHLTTQLLIDVSAPHELLGFSELGSWRMPLP